MQEQTPPPRRPMRIFFAVGWNELEDWLRLGWIVPPQTTCFRVVEYGPHVEWICSCPPVYPRKPKSHQELPNGN